MFRSNPTDDSNIITSELNDFKIVVPTFNSALVVDTDFGYKVPENQYLAMQATKTYEFSNRFTIAIWINLGGTPSSKRMIF